MGTKSAAFTSKIRNLQEICNRVVAQAFPQPSATDVANILKYFSQTLLSVLKDVPSIPMEVICSAEKDHWRCSSFPSLDYNGLYTILIQILEILPQIQGGILTAGPSLLQTICCLVPFLEHEYMDTLACLVANSFSFFPSSLQKELLDILCYNLLPFTVSDKEGFENQNFTNISVSSIMLLVFFYTDNTSYYTQLLECLMRLKKDVAKDLFCIIAHGSVKARCPAVELLFQYWPELNPSPLDRKTLTEKHSIWKPMTCQHENCSNPMNDAIKMSIDNDLATGSGDRAPPILLCLDCSDQLYRGKNRETLVDLLLPMEEIPYTCENSSCKAPLSQKIAIATCFSPDCANNNGNKPVRYCGQCDDMKHLPEEGKHHIVHRTIPSPWIMDSETLSYFVEAIISLLKEAQPIADKQNKESNGGRSSAPHSLPTEESNETMALEERQLLSRYGVWLLTSLCTPCATTPEEVLGRLLSMLFQWFHYTACLPDDQAGSALERLKGESIHGWLMKVVKTHFQVVVNCLVPHPKDYAKVGGHWDCWPSQTNQIKEGFKQLLCLVPYDIITMDVWSFIMPYWMECFRHEVTQEELAELKILLSKVLDPDLSPLGFTSKEMYAFINVRFENTTAPVQEQALYWLQILTMLEVPVPLKLLLTMFSSGVKSLAKERRDEEPFSPLNKVTTHPDSNEPVTVHNKEICLSCYILMLDILVKQMEHQEVSTHKGLETNEVKPVLELLYDILNAPWVGVHTCDKTMSDLTEFEGDVQCLYCELCAIWYQLALALVESFCPVMEVTMTDVAFEPVKPEPRMGSKSDIKSEDIKGFQKPMGSTADQREAIPMQELRYQSPTAEQSGAIRMASVCETQTDQVNPIYQESVVGVQAKSVTLTDEDVCQAKCTVSKPEIAGEKQEGGPLNTEDKDDGPFWQTSVGKFRFVIAELPVSLRLLYVLLQQLDKYNEADVLYHILYILKLMALHAEIMNKAARNHKGFLIWCQENLLIRNLWDLLQAEFSQISQLAVPLLLHCITLPSGRDMFWKVVEEDFHDSNWKARFQAVERVTAIAHFLEPSTVKNSPLLQASLANAFCYLVHCLDDIESTIAQRALLNLDSIKTSSLKLMVWCLETQFDLVIMDRPIILQTVFQLYNHLSERRFLTWDFFLNRFDALFLEAQISLERVGELSYTRDLKNSNINSEIYQKKLSRAQEALSHVHICQSLSSSFAEKMPYKRAFSVPLSTPTGLVHSSTDKVYPRQVSAPTFRRKSSKLMGNSAIPDKFSQHFPNNFFTDNQMKEKLAQEESHLMHVVHRAVDIEDHDTDTIHSLIFLLMQFLSRPDQSHPQEEKAMARNQQIVLRHLNILLGYSPTEQMFLIHPNNLRKLPTFNAVIASMPKVLDFNYKMGTLLLTTFLPLLIYCPAPQRFLHESHFGPSYSLWLLQQHVRQSWLMSVLIVLYKYSYNEPPLSKQIQTLIRIVMNTLENQFHRCRPLQDQYVSPVATRSRDMSTASMDLENIQEQDTVPDGPGKDGQGEDGNEVLVKTELSGESTEAEEEVDPEPELEVIPESPKSEACERAMENKRPSLPPPIQSEQVTIDIEIEETAPVMPPKPESNAPEQMTHRTSAESKKEKHVLKKDSTIEMEPERPKELWKQLSVEPEQPQSSDSGNKSPFRVSRTPSPKLSRLQRMGAIEGSLKMKPQVKKDEETKEPETRSSGFTSNLMKEETERVNQGAKKLLQGINLSGDSKPISTWTKDSPASVKPLLPIKPAPERLLPIGKPPFQKSSTLSSFSPRPSPEPPLEFSCQTERLLPIGPTPFMNDARKRFTSPPRCKEYYRDKNPAFRTNVLSKISKELLKSLESQEIVSDFERPSKEESKSDSELLTNGHSPKAKDHQRMRDRADSIRSFEKEKEKEKEVDKEREEQVDSRRPSTSALEKSVSLPINANIRETCLMTDGTRSMDETGPDQPKNLEITIKKPSPKKLPKSGILKPSSIIHPSLESLSQSTSLELLDEITTKTPPPTTDDPKGPRLHYKRRQRKTGLSTVEAQKSLESRNISSVGGVAANVQRRARKTDSSSTTGAASKRSSTSQSSGAPLPEDRVFERCQSCGNVYEEFSEEDIGICIVILGTYIHREPAMSASIMPEMLLLVAKYATFQHYPWQSENFIHIPGNSASIAKQFLRCTLHQLSANGIFQRIFSSYNIDENFFKAMALSLSDFVELNQVTPLNLLMEDYNERKELPSMSELLHVLSNISIYIECINLDSTTPQLWGTFLPLFETFLRKLTLLLPAAGVCNLSSIIEIMLATLKLPLINNHKTILEPYSKIISHAVLYSPIQYEQLLELCHCCGQVFTKDRDRYLLTRAVVFELHQAIKFKTIVPDENLLMLVQFILQDAGGTLVPSVLIENMKANSHPEIEIYSTNAVECWKQYVMDSIDFVADVHTFTRVKSNFLGTSIHLNEETLGGHLKAGLSQYLALEITKGNGRDHKAITRYLPWLYSLPSVQQGPKEFLDCVAHIRLLSWILLGSLQHSAVLHTHSNYSLSQPIPLEANGHIAEHIQVILAGFAEQSKASVLHMSSLFHAFILCQLWTMYCENISLQNPPGSEPYTQCTLTLSDFWAKITPGILQLICHSKIDGLHQLAEMVSLHFLSLMEALMDCNSNILARFLPMWIPVFKSYSGQLSGHLKVRLESCINWQPPAQVKENTALSSPLLRWLQKIQFKMGQIEMQSSAATQLYSV